MGSGLGGPLSPVSCHGGGGEEGGAGRGVGAGVRAGAGTLNNKV